MADRALTRSGNRMIAGVCGGIAEYLGWSPTLVRVLYAVGSVMSAAFPGIVVYLILWIVMPDGPREPRRFRVEDPRIG
ncbi:MAG TPA: PspC domain-containing protein [Longimicrobiaceae bacterium]